MNPDTIFSLCNLTAMAGWLLLIFAPRPRWSATVVTVIPLLLACVYITLVAMHWGEGPGGFSTLHAVAQLFANPWMLLAGWIHYLAFDLFIGAWEVRDSTQHRVPHIFVIPCLLLTFLFGPAGLLLYFVIRTLRGMSPKME